MEYKDNILCRGCLSSDRKMILVDDFMKNDCFLNILNEIPIQRSIVSRLWLCWECEALVARFLKFKQQVKRCSKIFDDFSEQKFHLSDLQQETKLQTQKVVELYLDPHVESQNNVEIINRTIPKESQPSTTVKEEDNFSPLSDNFDDDTVLMEYKTRKRKKKVKERKKKKINEDLEVITEVELTLEELMEERQHLVERDEYANAMFRCERCIVSFPNNDDLDDHVRLKHDANKSKFTCTVCECSFATEVSYNYHTNKHMKRYQCRTCMKRFNSRRGATIHYENTHCHGLNIEFNGKDLNEKTDTQESKDSSNTKQDSVVYPCELCAKTFRWKTSLRKHIETHRIEAGQKRKPYCQPCRLSFSTTSNLQKHVRTSSKHQIQLKLWKLKDSLPATAASADKQQARIEEIKQAVNQARQRFRCPQCGKTFQWRGNLHRHERSHKARANGELVCAPCNRTFSSIATYKQHMKISKKHVSENDFKYICDDCGKRFANKTRLKDHVDWEHLKNYVHTCGVCQKIFKSHTSLYLHKQVVHRKDSAEHLCDHCGKPFPNLAKLRSHVAAVHSGAAPYRCARCPARFSWHSCLSRHARRAHARRPNAAD